ncbi:unnamed protein product [Rhizophagus irregularis]|nr:unnamed protein product [Rhizophagus irregularis]
MSFEGIEIYSAIWKDGPLCKNVWDGKCTRNSNNKEVALKCLHNSRNPIESLINEVKRYPVKKFGIKIYGISQNPDTNDYILVQNNYINLVNWMSGNEKIDNFIQEMQMETNYSNIVFEWIPYNQFYEIKETGKNGFMTVYSAIWKDGPLCKNLRSSKCIRNSHKKVALKCLHNSHNQIESLINEVKRYSVKKLGYEIIKIYGISQNPDTNDYILVQNNFIVNWMSGNEKIDNFIQEMQLETSYSNIVSEWIPYNQFYEIKETGKNGFMTVYSAIWKDGPLCKNVWDVQNNFIVNWMSGNEKIDNFIQEMQLETSYSNIVFEWIPYNQFYEIEETGKNGFMTVYSAIWKDGPLCKNWRSSKCTRNSHKNIALKCLHNSHNQIESLINEVKSQFDEIKEIGKGGFATIYSAILNDFKVALKCLHNSQNLIDELLNEVKAYKVLLNNSRFKGGNFDNWININENYKCFNWQNKIRILYSISNCLKEIHEKQMVHRDFHTGNILFNTPFREEYANRIYISDMGLCGNVNDINRNNKNNIYGVMPYIAPEVLRGKPYTQAADIYSLGMIMYFVATGSQPFGNRAHDHNLVLDIYNEIRPEINEPEAPKSYIDLMKNCWDSNPENRPNITEFIESTSLY